MKTNFIIILSILFFIRCSDTVKNKQLENESRDIKTVDVDSKVKLENHQENDTINFVDNYLFNLSNINTSYLRNENLVGTFKDSLEVEKVTKKLILSSKEASSNDTINYDDKIFIDFKDFTLSFISNEDSEMFCTFKKFDILKDIILINVYLNDNQLTCVINKKQKSFQLIKGEAFVLDNDSILICNNDINFSSFKIYKIENNSILCLKNFYSLDKSFYAFYKNKKELTFLSTRKTVTTKYSLELN